MLFFSWEWRSITGLFYFIRTFNLALAFLERINIPEYDDRVKNSAWEYEETLTATGNGKTVLIPVEVDRIIVSLIPDPGGVGKIQTTMAKISDIRNDDQAVDWVDWTPGEVVEAIQDEVAPISAIRLVDVSGTVKIQMRVQ
jgi:hypothetical protein